MPERTPDLTVLLPKSAGEQGKGRNNVTGLLEDAGYDALSRKGFNRQDFVDQDGIRFVGVKDAPTLGEQLRTGAEEGLGVIMGADVLVEAFIDSRKRGVHTRIRLLLDIGVGTCTMKILWPNESPVSAIGDLEGRTIYTKYPQTLRTILLAQGVRADVEYVTGSEIRANENRGRKPVGAMEIVESGGSARENGLEIGDDALMPSPVALGVPFTRFPRVSTDLFGVNVHRMPSRRQDALKELGLALESSLRRNVHASIRFNVPSGDVALFREFGMRGPTVSRVVTRDGSDWSAVEICVPKSHLNRVRRELMELGASDLIVQQNLQAEPDAETSQVMRALRQDAAEDSQVWASRASAFLLGLDGRLAVRAASGDNSSSTIRALRAGVEACASKCGEEVAELAVALGENDAVHAREEAADVLYRFLVALRSRNVALSDLAPQDAQAERLPDAERLAAFLRANGTEPASTEPLLGLIKRWALASTAIRKSAESADVIARAGQFLKELCFTLRDHGLKVEDVIEVLEARERK